MKTEEGFEPCVKGGGVKVYTYKVCRGWFRFDLIFERFERIGAADGFRSD